jgi:hypothetical protein
MGENRGICLVEAEAIEHDVAVILLGKVARGHPFEFFSGQTF